MGQFYMTLPSNSSLEYFPDNTLTKFKVKLPESIRFEGTPMEVGLSELHFPHTWNNITGGRLYFDHPGTLGWRVCNLLDGHYDTVPQLIDQVQSAINESLLNNDPEQFKFIYNSLTRKVTIQVLGIHKLMLVDPVASILGFKHSTLIETTTTAPLVGDVNIITGLYVYTNIVSAQVVGDTNVPLLRTVPVEGRVGETVVKSYDRPHYLPVSVKHFDTVEINITDHTGTPVPFESGRVIVKLHFRPTRALFV